MKPVSFFFFKETTEPLLWHFHFPSCPKLVFILAIVNVITAARVWLGILHILLAVKVPHLRVDMQYY